MPEKLEASRIDHISIEVRNLKKAQEDFKQAFGWDISGSYSDHDEKINVAYYMIGETAVEIMEDMDGTGQVAKFIFAFLHPRQCHGVLTEIIDGQY